jgi:hypothetical protein
MRIRNGSKDNDDVRLDDGMATVRLREVENGAVISRRGVLWRAGLATAAGAAALTALDEQRAQAVTGGNFVLGQANNADNTTSLTSTSGITQGFSTLMALDGSSHVTISTLDVTGPTGGTAVYAHLGGSGSALSGASDSGIGVTGGANSGTGVSGHSGTGIGVHAISTSGAALKVSGKTKFSRSGAASVAQGNKTRTVTVSGMTASSLVLVTLQVSVAGLSVAGAVPAAGKFTVHLNKAAPTSMKFAWFVLSG